jgi:hypothetical protein
MAKYEKAVITNLTKATEYKGYPVVASFEDAKKIAIIESVLLAPRFLEQGFNWLSRWEVIVPFRPYSELAEDLVKKNSKEKIVQLRVGDLRVPVFDPRLVFIKTNDATKKLWEIYKNEATHWDNRIAFLIAVWEVKPFIKPLPSGRWIS